jgi:hypothetical protein
MAELRTAAAPQKKSKRELDHIQIREGENGGHVVKHIFQHNYQNTDEPWQSNEEEHVFADGEGEKLIDHLKKHAHIKSGEGEEKVEGKEEGKKRVKAGKQEHEGEDEEQE